jgi:hypothetical protein
MFVGMDPSILSSDILERRYTRLHLSLDVGIKDGSKAYVISYSAEQQEFHFYLSTVEKMIDPLRLV